MQVTVKEAMRMLEGLRGLDGRQRVVKDGDTEKIIMESYKFSPAFVWMLTKNHLALQPIEENYNEARKKMFRAVTAGAAGVDTKTEEGRKQLQEINEKTDELLAMTEEVKVSLIAQHELKLEDNLIPPTTLSMLGRLLKMED